MSTSSVVSTGAKVRPWRVPGRIAYVVSYAYPYASHGYAVRTHGVATALQQHGHSVIVISRPGRPWDLAGFDDPAFPLHHEIDGVRYLTLREPSARGLTSEAWQEAAAGALEATLRVFKPSVVMAASNWENALPALKATRALGVPFFYEIRGFWEVTRASREPEWVQSPEYRQAVERKTWIARQAERVFTLNGLMRDELVRRGVPAERIELVPNGIGRLPVLKPAESNLKQKLGIAEDERVIGYIGSFNPYEGLDVLLEACTELVQKGEKLKLLLVGDDQPLIGSSAAYIANAGLTDTPSWLIQVGRVPHDQVADYYALLDAVVIPRKPLAVCKLVPPMKAAEALAYGKRLVVSDVAPLAEYADKYEGVLSFAAGSVSNLAQALQRSLKLAPPAPSTELLFSAHTESMVKALRRLGDAPAHKPAVGSLLKRVEPTKQIADSTLSVFPLHQPNPEKPAIKLTRKVTWRHFDLDGDNIIRILGDVSVKNGGDRAGVLLVKLFDKNSKEISPDEVGLPKSDVFGGSFMYLQDTKSKKAQLAYIDIAKHVAHAKVGFALFQVTDKTEIKVSQLEVKATKFSSKEAAASRSVEKPKHASDYKVAIIADEFTSNSFSGEFQALAIDPHNWLDIFQDHQPDIFFCESAWAGSDPVKRPWRGKIYASINFPNENRKTLLSILEYCKKAGIPTVFWNKEDPTHHNDRVHDFVKTASLFDYVFTTAEECLESYKTNYGVKNVFVLPFGTNPRLFNPIETSKRNDHVVFAGSWYENHTERCKEMRNILDSLLQLGFKLDIYNRYHGDPDPLHIWPEKYSPYLLPAKSHHEMPDVYKSSVYGLNFNTVTSSSTMFARRVFELMSCNTLVVSNYSKGVDEMFGNLVVFPDRDPQRLKSFTQDEADSLRHKALHEVLEKHTYKQRWRSILQAIGLPYVENDTTLTFTYIVQEREEALSAISWYQQYGIQLSGSRLLLVADISMDPLDIAKFYQEFNRFGVSVTSMLHAEKYAIPDRYRPVETTHFVALRPSRSVDVVRIREASLHLQYMTENLVALAEQPDKRHRTAPASADSVLMGSADQFTDWMQRQTKKQISVVYWV